MMSPENLLRDKIIMLLVLKDFINMCPWSQLNKVFGQFFLYFCLYLTEVKVYNTFYAES